MARYIVVSMTSGLLFGLMDGLINANSLARTLYAVYAPIARSSVNIAAGILIDLVYGFALAGIFLILYRALPGSAGLAKGISFALLVWFLRVVMSVASQWMIIKLPAAALAYTLVSGLVEMLVLGVLYGLTLYPSR
jgi:hypothetical protein